MLSSCIHDSSCQIFLCLTQIGGDRLVLALHTLVEILSTEPAPVTDKDNAVCSNQLKAEYLLRTACYEVSFTQQLLQLLIG